MENDPNSADDLRKMVKNATQNAPFVIASLDKNGEGIHVAFSYKYESNKTPVEDTILLTKKIRNIASNRITSMYIEGVVEGVNNDESLTFRINPDGTLEVE